MIDGGSIPVRDFGCDRLQLVDNVGENSGEPHFASWNRMEGWLRQIERLRRVA